MNFNFEYQSSHDVSKIQPFEYGYIATSEYAFTYGRDIFSDLSKFNAPIFAAKKDRGVFYQKRYLFVDDNNGNAFINSEATSFQKIRKVAIREEDDNFLIRVKNNLFVYEHYMLEEIISHMGIQDEYFVKSRPPKRIVVSRTSFAEGDYNKTYLYNTYFLTGENNEISMCQPNMLLHRIIGEGSVDKGLLLNHSVFHDMFYNNKNIFALRRKGTIFGLNSSISLLRPKGILNEYEIVKVNHSNRHPIFTLDSIFAYHDSRCPISNIADIDFITRPQNTMFLDSYFNMSGSRIIDEFSIYKQTQTSVNNSNNVKDMIINDTSILAKIYRANITVFNVQQIIKRHIVHDMHKNNVELFGRTSSHDIIVQSYKSWLNKDSHNVIANRTGVKLSKAIKDLIIKKDNIFLHGDYENLYICNANSFLSKGKRDFIYGNANYFLKKDRHGFSISNTNYQIRKERHEFTIREDDTLLFRKKLGFVIGENDALMDKTALGFSFDDYSKKVYKDSHNFTISMTDVTLIPSTLPLNIATHRNTVGLLISSSSLCKQDILNVFSKEKEGFREYITRSFKKNKKASFFPGFDVFVYDESKKAFLTEYHIIQMAKGLKDSLLNNQTCFIQKNLKTGALYTIIDINKIPKHGQGFDSYTTWVTTQLRKTFLDYTTEILTKNDKHTMYDANPVYLSKNIKRGFKSDNEWIHKQEHKSYIASQSIGIDKSIIEAFVYDDELILDKARISFVIDSTLAGFTKDRIDIPYTQDEILAKRERFSLDDTSLQDYVFITKQQYEANPYVSEIVQMQKTIKDLEKPVVKSYNWAYVYQYEDPIDPSYETHGLDELLIPEKDIDYSSFEDIIFNKKTMRPKSPVKVIDDKTFIARYPIKHPMPKYEEVGIEYIDVPSTLMYELFLKFYQIWYANIFKFGNMSMVNSVKIMLDYMYSYIVLNFSGSEYLEPALRTFRLIRWFGETSVMHNAQYKISLEYEDLKSNLQTGSCMINNEMVGFFVNTKLKVISTDSTAFGNDAYIKLLIPNIEDTKITFSISFITGVVEIYLNDDLIDTITSNNSLISYDLPAADGVNEFVIKRTGLSNQNYCYVGNITVKNGAYKELQIEYDPELKAGNMPLNDVVNKMILFANMYDDEKESFDQFRKGNLAVSELFNKLKNYWELHHENKAKGKRLTIKET